MNADSKDVRYFEMEHIFQVSAVFRDPSLDSNMVLVVARVILYTEKKDSLVRSFKFEWFFYFIYSQNIDCVCVCMCVCACMYVCIYDRSYRILTILVFHS